MLSMQVQTPPHAWDLTPAAAIGVQQVLRTKVRADIPVLLEGSRLVAGIDVSSSKFNPILTAGIVVWDRITGQVIETVSAQEKGTFPYIPGLLSFREIPILLQAVSKLQCEPDVWMVDGHGIAHPRRLGIAAHFGVLIDRPTIGVAKSRLTGVAGILKEEAGSTVPLMDKAEQIGTVMRTKTRTNPLFVSPGHLIDQSSAEKFVWACLRGYRLPEPTRLAHLYVNEVRMGKQEAMWR